MVSFYGDNFTEDGRIFNREGKTRIMEVLFGGGDLLKLGGLIVKEAWLRDDGEGYPVNTRFLMNLREAFLRENADTLDTLGRPMRTAIEKVSRWIIVLYRNDQMYFERIGGCILFVIMAFPKFENDPVGLFHALKKWYFENEKREDRIEHMRKVFALVEERCIPDLTFLSFLDWCFRYIYDHREAFSWQVPSANASDRSIYDPLVWAGGQLGRGGDWVAVNGGHG
jgi:hypothetical protein